MTEIEIKEIAIGLPPRARVAWTTWAFANADGIDVDLAESQFSEFAIKDDPAFGETTVDLVRKAFEKFNAALREPILG